MATDTVTSRAEELLSREELKGRLLAVGAKRYHHLHSFHLRMHEGQLTRGQLQAWALNRYYYQSRIPIKDALVLAKSDDPAFRVALRNGFVSRKLPAYRGSRFCPARAFSRGFDTPSMLTSRWFATIRCWLR